MRATTPDTIDVTAIRIVNEVTGEVTSKVSPQSISEAMDVDGDVALAKDFIKFQECRDKPDRYDPLSVCVFKSHGRGIVIYWHPTGSIEAARAAWEEAQQDDWRVWL